MEKKEGRLYRLEESGERVSAIDRLLLVVTGCSS